MGLLAAGEALHQFLDHRHAGGAADEDDVVDLAHRLAPVLDGLVEGLLELLDQVLGELLEGGAGELHLEVDRPGGLGGGEERQGDGGLGRLGELDLCLLGGFLEALEGHTVVREVDAVVVLHVLDHVVDDPLVPVVSTEVRVTGGGLDLEDALADLQQRHVEGPTAEVEDEDGLVGGLVESVGKRRGRGLVDDPEHLEAGDLSGFLGGLALGVVEVGGDGDDGLHDLVAQVGFGVPLQLHQDLGRDLLGRPALPVDGRGPGGPHLPLDGAEGPVGVRDGLAFGDLSDEDLSGLAEGDHRGGGPMALGVGDDDGFPSLEDRDHGVGGPQVNSYGFRHGTSLSSCSFLLLFLVPRKLWRPRRSGLGIGPAPAALGLRVEPECHTVNFYDAMLLSAGLAWIDCCRAQ